MGATLTDERIRGTFSSFVAPTKDYVLFLPQSRERINSGRAPRRRIAGENRGA